jgi:hypothetical protein
LTDLVVFVALVGLIGAAGIVLGMLASRQLGAWDDRRAGAADAVEAPGVTGTTTVEDPGEDGGENG